VNLYDIENLAKSQLIASPCYTASVLLPLTLSQLEFLMLFLHLAHMSKGEST